MSNSLKQETPRGIAGNGLLKISIAEGRAIHLEIPVESENSMTEKEGSEFFPLKTNEKMCHEESVACSIRHILKNCAFPVTEVRLGEQTSFKAEYLLSEKVWKLRRKSAMIWSNLWSLMSSVLINRMFIPTA